MVLDAVEYENLTPWKHPRDYGGQTWYGWYAVAGQSRDSDALEKSNYRRILEDLQALNTELAEVAIDSRQGDYDSPGDSTVCDTSCSHWAVGWVETIYVHSSNVEACKLADEILSALTDYPVYDESDMSELESEAEGESYENWARHEFTRGIESAIESHMWESFDADVPDPDQEKRVRLVTDLWDDYNSVQSLFYETADTINQYWEHDSEGPSINVDKIVAAVDIPRLIQDLGEGEYLYHAALFCRFDPFQMWFDFVV